MQRLAKLVSYVFDPENSMVLELAPDSRMRIRLNDGYWFKLRFRRFEYEPEVRVVIERVAANRTTCFVDCGANIGYWSIEVSSLLAESERVVAIEASPTIFEQLRENATLNGNRFECLRAAVWSQSNETLIIRGVQDEHVAARIVDTSNDQPAGSQAHTVDSVTLDGLAHPCLADPELDVVVKLDVEGAEIAAFLGARRLLAERRPLVIYEDHGSEHECRASKFVLDELGFEVYWCAGRLPLRRMRSVSDVQAVKANRHKGYNFFGCDPSSTFAPVLRDLAHSVP